jgi:transcriptional regulator with XRE-family HTH domain
MPSAFGTVLRRLRERRGLSFREVGQLSGIDHAYVYRLETGEKEAPSPDALAGLFRALKPTKREEHILRFLVGRDVDLNLVDPLVLDDPEVILPHFESAAKMSFRGKRPSSPEEWKRLIARFKALEESDDDG